ncbi:MAG: DinB family protein [Thermoanaerobaculia bacterium]
MNSRLIELADHYWSEYLRKIETAVAPLTEDELWWRSNEGSNSIANLLAHLHGNLSQWVLSGLAGQPFERHRDAEFAARAGTGSPSKDRLVADLRETVTRCREAIRGLSPEELARVRKIQKYELDGYQALFHTVEHMSYHTGQIVLVAKQFGAPLDFYPQHRGE